MIQIFSVDKICIQKANLVGLSNVKRLIFMSPLSNTGKLNESRNSKTALNLVKNVFNCSELLRET